MFFSLLTQHPWWIHALRGVLFILTGIVIFAYPKILVAMISALLFIIGSFIIAHALYMRKLKKSGVNAQRDHFTFHNF